MIEVAVTRGRIVQSETGRRPPRGRAAGTAPGAGDGTPSQAEQHDPPAPARHDTGRGPGPTPRTAPQGGPPPPAGPLDASARPRRVPGERPARTPTKPRRTGNGRGAAASRQDRRPRDTEPGPTPATRSRKPGESRSGERGPGRATKPQQPAAHGTTRTRRPTQPPTTPTPPDTPRPPPHARRRTPHAPKGRQLGGPSRKQWNLEGILFVPQPKVVDHHRTPILGPLLRLPPQRRSASDGTAEG